jgi:hypothetical protein
MNKIGFKIAELAALNTADAEFGLILYEKGYPIWKEYASKTGIVKLDKLEEWFGNKKQVNKFVKLLLSYNDAIKPEKRGPSQGQTMAIPNIGNSEYHFTIKNFAHLIRLLEYDRITKLIRMIIAKRVDFHEWIANLPRIHKDDSPETVFQILKRFMKFNKETRYEMMSFMNYKKIREAKNANEAMKHVRVVKMARNKMSKSDIVPANMSICDLFNGDRDDDLEYVDQSKILQFSKDPIIVGSIGQETHCCFRKGGLAASLLAPALKSPISGIIHGYRPNRWFSFIWEMVVEEDGVFKKNLVLDNIEATKRLPVDFYNSLAEQISTTQYSRVYLGTSRNDIELPSEVTQGRIETDHDDDNDHSNLTGNTIKKPVHMIGYESNFKKYSSYDDSSNLYTLIKQEDDVDVIVHPMTPGDLHRCKYIEQDIYAQESEADVDFLKINVKASPSYVWESKTAIYGYFATRLKWYWDTWERYEQNEDISLSEFRKKVKENKENELPPTTGMVKVLYLEDIFLLPNRDLKVSLKEVFDHLIAWCHKHSITNISGSMNESAKNFKTRIEAEGFTYYAQTNTPMYNAVYPDEIIKPTSVAFQNIEFEEEKKPEKKETETT